MVGVSYCPSTLPEAPQLPKGPCTSDSSNNPNGSGKVTEVYSLIQQILMEHLFCAYQALFQALGIIYQ